MSKIGELIVAITGDNSGLQQSLGESSKAVDSFGQQVGNALAGMASLAALTGAAIKGIEFNKAAQQAQVAFEVMTGSAQVAADTIKELRDYAEKTPLEFKDIRQSTQTLIQFGLSAKDAIKTVKQLGDVSGGDAQKLQSLAVAMGQIQSTGRLMGQDLNQLINAGFNPLKEISETTGKSMAQLKADMEKGAISAEMVADSFTRATSEGGQFYGMLEKQSKTLAGAQSTFNDALDTFLGKMTAGMTGPLTSAFQSITGNLESLGSNVEAIGVAGGGAITILSTALDVLAGALKLIPGPILAIATAMGVAKAASIALGASMGPLGLAISAAVGGFAWIVGSVHQAGIEEIERKYGELAKELGVTADEAKRFAEEAERVGISAKEVKVMADNMAEVAKETGLTVPLAERIADQVEETFLVTGKLSDSVRAVAEYHGVSATNVAMIAANSTRVANETRKQLDDLVRTLKVQDLINTRGNANAAALKKIYDDGAEARAKAREDAIKEAEANAQAAKKEADKIVENLNQWKMTEQEKLDFTYQSERAKLVAAGAGKTALTLLDKKYKEDSLNLLQEELDKRRELANAEADAIKKDADDAMALRFELAKEEISSIDTVSAEQLDAYKKEVEAMEITTEQKKALIASMEQTYKDSLDRQKEETLYWKDSIVSVLNELADLSMALTEARKNERIAQLEDELEQELELRGLAEETKVEQLERERDEAIKNGDMVLAKEKQDALDREKIVEKYKKKMAQAEYDAAMESYNLAKVMAVVNAASAIVSIWANSKSFYEGLIQTVIVAASTATQIATIEANKPQKPKFFTGTTNPLGQATAAVVGDQGMELVLPRGSEVLNNRETMDVLGGQSGSMRATIQVVMDGRSIAENTVDLINNGVFRLEVSPA